MLKQNPPTQPGSACKLNCIAIGLPRNLSEKKIRTTKKVEKKYYRGPVASELAQRLPVGICREHYITQFKTVLGLGLG